MINAFDTEVAQDVGLAAAILYYNIQYWCRKNRANGMNEHEGYFWTYNSQKAYRELFPYLSEKTIRRSLEKLEEKGYIKIGCFNSNGRDRTRWYADIRPIKNNIEEVSETDCNTPKGQMQEDNLTDCNTPEGQMDTVERTNANCQKGEPLPDNYHITTHITTNNKKERKKAESTMTTFNEILDSSDLTKNNPELREAIIDFIKMRQRNRKPLTDRALKENINDAYRLAQGDPKIMTELFVQSIKNGWQGIWELKENTAPANKPAQQSENPYYQRLKERGLT